MSVSRILLVALAAVGLALGGCTIESPLAVRRVWADYNTLRTPAVFYEKTSRVPMDSARVKELHWMYNAGPDGPGELTSPPLPTGQSAGANPAPVPSPPAQSTPLPPHPGKMQTPVPAAPSSAQVAAQRPDAGRTAQSRDAWRFIH